MHKAAKIALWVMAGFGALFFLLLIVAAIVGPVAPPETSPASTKATAAKVVKPAPAEEAKPALPEDQATRDPLLLAFRQIAMPSGRCDFDFNAVADLMAEVGRDQTKLMELYSAAHKGEKTCTDGSKDLSEIELPKLSVAVQNKNLELHLSECLQSTKMRTDALNQLKSIIDGDFTYAGLQAVSDQINDARSYFYLCRSGLQYVGRESGLEADAMSFLKP